MPDPYTGVPAQGQVLAPMKVYLCRCSVFGYSVPYNACVIVGTGAGSLHRCPGVGTSTPMPNIPYIRVCFV
jgi:hypothetical protein